MKSKKLFSLLCLVGALGLGSLSSCGETSTTTSSTSSTEEKKPEAANSSATVTKSEDGKTYTAVGVYKYSKFYSTESFYGVQVKLTIDGASHTVTAASADKYVDEKNDKTYNDVTPSWLEGDGKEPGTAYNAAKADIVAYKGKTVKALIASTEGLGYESEKDDFGTTPKGGEFTVNEGVFYVTGATQSSGRVNAAANAALKAYAKQILGQATPVAIADKTARTASATYLHVSHNSLYGVKVDVSFNEDGKLATATVVDSATEDTFGLTWNNMTPFWAAGEGKDEAAAYEASKKNNGIYKAFENKTAAEIVDLTKGITTESKKEALALVYYTTGATQTSSRINIAMNLACQAYVNATAGTTPDVPETPSSSSSSAE